MTDMAIDKNLHPELAKLQLDLEDWLKEHKPRNPYVVKTWRRGHGVETPKVKYTRKRKHKHKQE
jgi:hypothetical protein|tara:strand:- start:6733 stop:6924 length:192 start_codon:yes stop_codon:yes gene_type:complete